MSDARPVESARFALSRSAFRSPDVPAWPSPHVGECLAAVLPCLVHAFRGHICRFIIVSFKPIHRLGSMEREFSSSGGETSFL